MSRHGRTRRVLVVAGLLTMGYAVAGAAADPDIRPGPQLLLLAALPAAHDTVILPAAVGVGVVIGRIVPAGARVAVQVAGFVTATLLVVAAPLLLGPHPRPDDPSVLPGQYGRGLVVIIGAVWAVAVTATLVRHAARRLGGPRDG